MAPPSRSRRPQRRSIGLAVGCALLFRLGAELSPYVGFTLAMATMVLLGGQAFGFIRVWPRRTTPEHPVVVGVYWGLILGLIVPGAVATLLDKGVFGLLSAAL